MEVRHRERWSPSPEAVFFVPYLIAVIGVALLEAGLYLTGATMLGIAYLASRLRERITAHLDRGPAVEVIEHTRPGLTDREVEEFRVLHQEYLKMQEEQREEARKDARQNGGNGPPLNKR